MPTCTITQYLHRDSKRENLCQQDSERVTRMTAGAPIPGNWNRLEHQAPGDRLLQNKKFDNPAKNFKPQSEEEHEIFNQVLNSICANFGTSLTSLLNFLVNVAIWSQRTSDCLWASSWFTKDREHFKRMAMNERVFQGDTRFDGVCATTSENDRSQHSHKICPNVAGLKTHFVGRH